MVALIVMLRNPAQTHFMTGALVPVVGLRDASAAAKGDDASDRLFSGEPALGTDSDFILDELPPFLLIEPDEQRFAGSPLGPRTLIGDFGSALEWFDCGREGPGFERDDGF